MSRLIPVMFFSILTLFLAFGCGKADKRGSIRKPGAGAKTNNAEFQKLVTAKRTACLKANNNDQKKCSTVEMQRQARAEITKKAADEKAKAEAEKKVAENKDGKNDSGKNDDSSSKKSNNNKIKPTYTVDANTLNADAQVNIKDLKSKKHTSLVKEKYQLVEITSVFHRERDTEDYFAILHSNKLNEKGELTEESNSGVLEARPSKDTPKDKKVEPKPTITLALDIEIKKDSIVAGESIDYFPFAKNKEAKFEIDTDATQGVDLIKKIIKESHLEIIGGNPDNDYVYSLDVNYGSNEVKVALKLFENKEKKTLMISVTLENAKKKSLDHFILTYEAQ